MSESILLVEDNDRIMNGNARMLRRRGYSVWTAFNLAEARKIVSERPLDAIVLDIMLPDGSGLDFTRELRQSSEVPILLLTGLTAGEDVVAGFRSGGDDYLAKPYDFGVLLARIESLLRRAASIPATFRKGELEFDIIANKAFLNGEDLSLTHKEFAVLLLLAKNERKPLSAEYLYETAWKRNPAPEESAVKTVVSRLRRKLGEGYFIDMDQSEGGYVFTAIRS
ncbi:MAG: response regulator transcription factor [Deltaproteobacteria bacterium]|jgi:DNA-binding response OmpR family regulator|nr:response regulator transcription factor [Deltaproteobacteria bacterium]